MLILPPPPPPPYPLVPAENGVQKSRQFDKDCPRHAQTKSLWIIMYDIIMKVLCNSSTQNSDGLFQTANGAQSPSAGRAVQHQDYTQSFFAQLEVSRLLSIIRLSCRKRHKNDLFYIVVGLLRGWGLVLRAEARGEKGMRCSGYSRKVT